MSFLAKGISCFSVLFWEIFFLASVAGLSVVGIFVRNKKGVLWGLLVLLTGATGVLLLHGGTSAKSALSFSALLFFSAVACLPAICRTPPKKPPVVSEKGGMPATKRKNALPAVEIPAEKNTEIHLDYVLRILKKLRSSALSTGDRLEVENIGRTLAVFRATETPTAEASARLNDALSALLKLMSRYGF